MKPVTRWGLKWVSENRLDGRNEYLIFENLLPALFVTRAEARAYRDEHYGFIRERPDLRAEPYGWQLPQVVRVSISIEGATA